MTLYQENLGSKMLHMFHDVPTVKVMGTYYEVISKLTIDGSGTRVPVARFPISNTNMIIEN